MTDDKTANPETTPVDDDDSFPSKLMAMLDRAKKVGETAQALEDAGAGSAAIRAHIVTSTAPTPLVSKFVNHVIERNVNTAGHRAQWIYGKGPTVTLEQAHEALVAFPKSVKETANDDPEYAALRTPAVKRSADEIFAVVVSALERIAKEQGPEALSSDSVVDLLEGVSTITRGLTYLTDKKQIVDLSDDDSGE